MGKAKRLGAHDVRKWITAGMIFCLVSYQLQQSPKLHLLMKDLSYAKFADQSSLPSLGVGFAPQLQKIEDIFPDPYLVVCQNVPNIFIPMFTNFTVIRLGRNQPPPPWNATVFLYPEGSCKDHTYVKESLERRRKAPFLVAPNLSSTDLSSESGGVRWPNFSSNSTKYLRLIHERPAIIGVKGEVFWRMHYAKESCGDVDFVIYREVETLLPNCLTVHYLQGVSSSMERGEDGQFGFHNTSHILQGTVVHPNKPTTAQSYEIFCSFIVKYNSSQPMQMFGNRIYDIDAIVRHMFFLQLNEYKQCQRITDCPGGPYTAFNCMVGYKFHITMDNTLVDGYVSEKLFNGALAGGIPIYFGASDVGKYVNDKSFIHCNVSRDVIEEMRSFYPRQNPRPFLFKNTSERPTDEELISWASKYLRPQLAPCIQRVVELDKNDEEYMSILHEPFLLDDTVMSGRYPLLGVATAYNILKKPQMLELVQAVP